MTEEPDTFDVALRRLIVEERILKRTRRTVERYGLDPALAQKVERDIASGDLYALIGTMCACLRAVGRATGKPQPDLVKRMRALRRLLPEEEG